MTASNSVFRPDILAGKVALVTGGGTGICKGIASALARHGAETVLLSRSMEHLRPTADEISAATGQRCVPVVADVRDYSQVQAAVVAAIADIGPVDILVNGAAGNFLCKAADLSANGFGAVVDIDAKGTWHCSKAVFDACLKERGGQILNISATLHYGGTPMQLHAAAAKAAVDALTKNLAVEWGPLGIRVNAIAPGPIGDTEGVRRLLPGDLAEKLRKKIPVQRFGLIDDIANLALFILSPAGTNLNGSIMVSDGGAWLVGNLL